MERATVLAAVLLVATAAPIAGADEECVTIDDFAKATVGAFPDGWQVRKDDGKRVYRVEEEGGQRFLRATSKEHGIQAARSYEWDLNRYPVLAWSWRPREFPREANEKDGENDSVLAVYMAVPYSKIRGPKTVKYIWSEVVPTGTRLESNGGLTQVRVLESGADRKNQWVEERVNVRDDYLAFFEEKETPKPGGIAILTDSDDTETSASGDYAKFRVCTK